jgi:hypothetical protein
MIRLESLDKGSCTPINVRKSSAALLSESVGRRADGKLRLPIFLSGDLLSEGVRQMIQRRANAMSRVTNRKAQLWRWLLDGGDFFHAPPISVTLSNGSAGVVINDAIKDSLSLSYVDFGSPELENHRREVAHDLAPKGQLAFDEDRRT